MIYSVITRANRIGMAITILWSRLVSASRGDGTDPNSDVRDFEDVEKQNNVFRERNAGLNRKDLQVHPGTERDEMLEELYQKCLPDNWERKWDPVGESYYYVYNGGEKPFQLGNHIPEFMFNQWPGYIQLQEEWEDFKQEQANTPWKMVIKCIYDVSDYKGYKEEKDMITMTDADDFQVFRAKYTKKKSGEETWVKPSLRIFQPVCYEETQKRFPHLFHTAASSSGSSDSELGLLVLDENGMINVEAGNGRQTGEGNGRRRLMHRLAQYERYGPPEIRPRRFSKAEMRRY